MLQSIKKLRGRSANEISTRARQFMSKTFERFAISRFIDGIPSILKVDRGSRAILAPWAADKHDFLALLENNWPGERHRLSLRADDIVAGRFDLLGYSALDFGSPLPDWHFDPVSGKRSPRVHWSQINEISADETGDKKVIWELNRHQHFVTLGQAYLLTGDERYAKVYADQLRSWFSENPPKIGVNWLSSLELAFRSISWIRAFFLFEESPVLTDSIRMQMFRYLFIQARHIEKYLSTYFSPNTHLTGEALGLYYIGTFLDAGSISVRWKETGFRILMDWLNVHVRLDGSYCEQASHYARYTADFYADLRLIREREGLPCDPKHKERLNSLFTFLLHLTQPDGTTPLIGDDDGGSYFPFDSRPIWDMRGALSIGAMIDGRGDLKYVIDDPQPDIIWIAGTGGLKSLDAIESKEPFDEGRAFSDGGFFVHRSSWQPDADHIVVSCGPHGFKGGGHAHADALSFTASLAGKPVFTDAGTYVYTADLIARNRYRSSDAHNCLTIDGQSSSIPAGPFSWKTRANAHLVEWQTGKGTCQFRGSHDGFSSIGVSYERAITIGPGATLQIVDYVKSPKRIVCRVNFILAPGVNAKIENGDIRLSINEIEIRMVNHICGKVDAEAMWKIEDFLVSPIYGRQDSTNRLVLIVSGCGDIKIETKVSWQRILQREFDLL